MRLTDWYPQHIKPVRAGVYQTWLDGHIGYAYWSGSRWGGQWMTAEKAAANREHPGAEQRKTWRGVDRKTFSRESARILGRELVASLAAAYGPGWAKIGTEHRRLLKRAALLELVLQQPDERFGVAQEFITKILATVE
jgi:hypothetical protein